MMELKSCLILSCFLSALDLVTANPVGPKDNTVLWTEIGEVEEGDIVVVNEDVTIDAKNPEKTFFMPYGYEFTRVRIEYPRHSGVSVAYPHTPAKYKFTIRPKSEILLLEGLKYKVEIRAKPIRCETGTNACRLELLRRIELLKSQVSGQ